MDAFLTWSKATTDAGVLGYGGRGGAAFEHPRHGTRKQFYEAFVRDNNRFRRPVMVMECLAAKGPAKTAKARSTFGCDPRPELSKVQTGTCVRWVCPVNSLFHIALSSSTTKANGKLEGDDVTAPR